jgi:mannose-6-phosphate isomerase
MKSVYELLIANNFTIVSSDLNRPWGGFFVIDENQAQQFSDFFMESMDIGNLRISGKLSPKILIIKPNSRLSWQYHNRRAEIWRVIQGTVGIVRSETDEEKEMYILNTFDVVNLKQGERHRLVGLKELAVVAEIWQHVLPGYPSDEDDIVRVQDDFGR